MQPQKFPIPQYKKINDFLVSIHSKYKTTNNDFFYLPLKENSNTDTYKTAFMRDFLACVCCKQMMRVNVSHLYLTIL
jgi:hypothetical protein